MTNKLETPEMTRDDRKGRLRERPARVRRNGRLVRPRRPDSAANARPKKVYITHGLGSQALLRDPLDLRTAVGKAYHAHKAMLRSHVGGDPTPPQEKLIDQAARLAVLSDVAWSELARIGRLIKGDALHPAFEAFLKATREQRDVLRLLGLDRRKKDVPSLHDYLRQKGAQLPEIPDAP